MEIKELINRAKKSSYLKISEKELEELLSKSKVVEEKDTLISGKLRLLNYNNILLVQEQSDKGELLLRFMENEKAANKLIDERMEIYDKMWDGCGCRVHYYE